MSWRAQREIFACGGGAICSQRGQISAPGLPGAPLIARRCSAIAPDHFATIGGHVGSAAGDLAWRPPSPCPWARPQPPTRQSQACLAVRFALPSPQHSPTPHPSFSCDGHSPCCRRRRLRSSAGSISSPPASKWMCGPGASASAHLAPWKGHRRCTFHRRRPPAPSAPSAAILAKISAHKRIGHLFSSLQDLLSQLNFEPLRSRLDPN